MKVRTDIGQSYVRVTARSVEPFERAAAGLDLHDDRPKRGILWGLLPMLLATGVCVGCCGVDKLLDWSDQPG